jgi:hypothetical protein
VVIIKVNLVIEDGDKVNLTPCLFLKKMAGKIVGGGNDGVKIHFLLFGTTTKREGKKVRDGAYVKMLSAQIWTESEN